jgi:hypothetical protein
MGSSEGTIGIRGPRIIARELDDDFVAYSEPNKVYSMSHPEPGLGHRYHRLQAGKGMIPAQLENAEDSGLLAAVVKDGRV